MTLLAVLATCVALAVAGCTGNGAERGTSAQRDDGRLARLRDGGLTIVIRHAATDRSQPDAPTVVLEDCATQRNLSGQGRADARAIGTAVDGFDIPVGEIWASPYCRSRDTAELAFGRFEVVPGLERLHPERDDQADRHLNQLIREQAPSPGEPNLVIASHGVYPSVLAPAVPLEEGEAALYARGNEGFELVDRMVPNEWVTLGADTDPDAGEPSAAVARVRTVSSRWTGLVRGTHRRRGVRDRRWRRGDHGRDPRAARPDHDARRWPTSFWPSSVNPRPAHLLVTFCF